MSITLVGELFKGLEEDEGHIGIVTLPDAAYRGAKPPDEVEAVAAQIDDEFEPAGTFFTLGVQPPHLRDRRAKASEVVGIGGLWMDLDTTSTGAKRRFASKPEIMSFLGSLPRLPSAVVDSGGGIHAYWIFREVWMFDDDDERRHAVAVLRGWVEFAAGLIPDKDIDRTHDLARIFRVPGTHNRKPGLHQAPVVPDLKPFGGPGRRYNPGEFEKFRAPERTDVEAEIDDVLVRPTVARERVDAEKLRDLMNIEPRMAATWNFKRPDLVDQSPSAYEMSLANFAMQAGWSDQEIVDLMVAWRTKHELPPKSKRTYETTLTKAKQAVVVEPKVREDFNEMVDEGELDSTLVKRRALQLIHRTGIPVERVLKYGRGEQTLFELVLDDERHFFLGPASRVISQQAWKELAVVEGVPYRHQGRAGWQEVVRATTVAAEWVTDLDSVDDPYLHEWLSGLLRMTPDTDIIDIAEEGDRTLLEVRGEAMSNTDVWIESQYLVFRVRALEQYARSQGARPTPTRQHLAQKLVAARLATAPRTVTGIGREQRKTTARVWEVPLKLIDAHDRESEAEVAHASETQ